MADTDNPGKGSTDASKGSTGAPPWGDDFDAATAWRLVQNLRTDKENLTTERDALKTKLTEAEATATEATDKVTAAEAKRDELQREVYVAKALRAHPDLEDYVEFLTGDTEEAILDRAARLSSIGRKPDDADKGGKGGESTGGDGDNSGDGLPGRPEPKLKPGHGGDAPQPFDPDAIAAAARSHSY